MKETSYIRSSKFTVVQVATAGAQALIRFGSAAFVSGKLSSTWNRPKQPIELYEFEVCLLLSHSVWSGVQCRCLHSDCFQMFFPRFFSYGILDILQGKERHPVYADQCSRT